jgi:signal transduction histidine kinase
MRSLSLKLTLAFLLVGVLAVALVGTIVRVRSQNAYDRWIYDQGVSAMSTALESYYEGNGSWDGVQQMLASRRMEGMRFDPRRSSMALLDSNRQPILLIGEISRNFGLSESSPGRAVPLTVGGDAVGYLLLDRLPVPPPDRRFLPEELFLQRVGRATLYGALGAIILALLVGALLARTLSRPIRELTEATQAVARGELGRQVPVRSSDEIGQLAASFNQMSVDLARTTDARKQMTADVAHELRTPLSVILGYTEALEDGKLRGDTQAYAAMHETALHLQRVVDDLRILALADANELPLNRRAVDPRALLERAALTFATPAQQAGVSLSLDAAEDLPEVHVDPDRISQVLNNLVSNALRHTPPGGAISLSAAERAGDQAVSFRVADTGSGIAPEDLPFVFDRFYRGDKARVTQNGESGLGLAIVRSIVEGHGGAVKVASAAGEGTTFTLSLPIS